MQEYKNLKDEEIAKIVQEGDAEAYSVLVERYQPKLTRYINCLARNTEITDDVVQETLIKGFVNLKGFNTERKFSSWIYRIAHNEAINQIKKAKWSVSLHIFEEVFGSKENIELGYEKEEAKRILKENIDKLPTRYAEVLMLHYLEDRPYKEISDILRVSIGTVGTWINRGKKLLREMYKNDD